MYFILFSDLGLKNFLPPKCEIVNSFLPPKLNTNQSPSEARRTPLACNFLRRALGRTLRYLTFGKPTVFPFLPSRGNQSFPDPLPVRFLPITVAHIHLLCALGRNRTCTTSFGGRCCIHSTTRASSFANKRGAQLCEEFHPNVTR